MGKFDKLKRYDVAGRTARWYPPILGAIVGEDEETGEPIRGIPWVEVVHTGRSNKAYSRALAKESQGMPASILRAQQADPTLVLEHGCKSDRKLFPTLVCRGWYAIPGDDDLPVEWSIENCTEFLDALPDNLFDQLRTFCAVQRNFLEENEPTDAEVEEQAGNS